MTVKIKDFRFSLFALFLCSGLSASLPSTAAFGEEEKEKLPVPRFVSLKHGEINLRVGPGRRYPISWVYKRKQLPVEIIAEFDIWHKIRDADGTVGWVIKQAVSGNRTAIVTADIRILRDDPSSTAGTVAKVEAGAIGKLLECPARAPDWCRLDFGGTKGWLARDEFWGVYPKELIQ